MNITESDAMKLWKNCFGNVEFAQDCFGTWMCKRGWGNSSYEAIRPGGDGKMHDYSWNVDHIRPKSSYTNEDDSFFFGNYEPMHRLNNEEKGDNFPHFTIGNNRYAIVNDGYGGYGIINDNGYRVDQKNRLGIYYKL